VSESLSFSQVYHYDTLKPGITVVASLQHNGAILECEAKIDTGSSHCIFKRDQGELIGIDIESVDPVRISTVTGSFDAFPHWIQLEEILGITTNSQVMFASEPSFTRNVLGRSGWLDHVKLGLVDYEGKLFLNSYE
jgi:hypothetical protein